MNLNNKSIGQRIRYYRILRGMSQEQLSKCLGYHSRSAVYNIENGLSGIPARNIITAAKILDVSVDDLLNPFSSNYKNDEVDDNIISFDLRNYSADDKRKIKEAFDSILSLITPKLNQLE